MKTHYEALRARGFQLAGDRTHLARRASVYHQLFRDSGERNVFPLIAAHGALWARGFFQTGSWLASMLSQASLLGPEERRRKLAAYAEFADAFRDINRRVCAEAFALFHYARHWREPGFHEAPYDSGLIEALADCHDSRARNTTFSPPRRRALFRFLFEWEQRHIAQPAVEKALADFDWPLFVAIARKTRVRFRYQCSALQFTDFFDEQQRVRLGLLAYDQAEAMGLNRVEQALGGYQSRLAGFPETVSRCYGEPWLEPGARTA